jgi:hypothetical protein
MTNKWISNKFLEMEVQKYLHLLPTNFDWQFYIKVHQDLQQAGIDNEKTAIEHYLLHGMNEHRIFCSLDNHLNHIIRFDNKKRENKIILFTQWYEADEQITKNLSVCLNNNLNNQYVDYIHIFYETETNFFDHVSQNTNLNKIKHSRIKQRLSYNEWMAYANNYYLNDIKVLINSDIYFDSSLSILKKLYWNKKTLYVCSRIDLSESQKLIPSRETYDKDSPLINPLYSHDCWIYQTPLIDFENSYFLGYENCDRKLQEGFVSSGGKIINLYQNMNCIHIDYRSKKNRQSYSLV